LPPACSSARFAWYWREERPSASLRGPPGQTERRRDRCHHRRGLGRRQLGPPPVQRRRWEWPGSAPPLRASGPGQGRAAVWDTSRRCLCAMRPHTLPATALHPAVRPPRRPARTRPCAVGCPGNSQAGSLVRPAARTTPLCCRACLPSLSPSALAITHTHTHTCTHAHTIFSLSLSLSLCCEHDQ
jgi:hypothetical protein